MYAIRSYYGLMAMAQWSACAWETAAIYGPEYKQPRSDVPKALFICGAICLLTFILVQAACTGTRITSYNVCYTKLLR